MVNDMNNRENSNGAGTTALIIIVIIAIIVVVFLLLSNPSSGKLSCNATLVNNLPTNTNVKVRVTANGENATVETNEGVNTNQSVYEANITANGTYTFYAVSGSSKESCTINVTNIDKNPPTGSITIDSTERNLAAKLTIKATDDVGLASDAYSWNKNTWSSNNSLIVSSNGKYTGYVKDKAGNITTLTYNVTTIGNPTVTAKVNMYTNTTKTLVVDEGTVKTWKSNDGNVVAVDQNGKVTAKIAGTATVTAILTNGDLYEFVITVTKTNVKSITLNQTSAKIKPKGTVSLSISKIDPSNASCDTINWKSSNTSVATVSAGLVTGVKDGTSVITVTCDGVSATATITVKSTEPPIVPTSASIKYEGETLKYYVQNKSSYYLTYIWMADPYNQIKKFDSNTAKYGSVMSDSELASAGKSPVRMSVGEMFNAYISRGMIPSSKAAIGYNASGFYVKGAWEPPSDFYHNRSSSWVVLTDGKVTRKRINESDGPRRTIIGINSSGDLQIYGKATNTTERQALYNTIIASGTKNTWDFDPLLVKNGQVNSWMKENAQRQAICQVNSNNYIMFTTIYNACYADMADLLVKLGCKTAFNLDGGGSTSLFYKKPGQTSATKVKCSDGSNHSTCRSIVEGIYFVEK